MTKQTIYPAVSIVMCTFRGAAFVGEQLQSFLVQTLQPAELIVCDDRSDDGTVALVERFRDAAPFPVRIVVNEQNLGSTRNFDQALELASGELLALCDQDDVWFPEKLETLARALHENPQAGGVFSDAVLIDDQGRALKGARGGDQTMWRLHGFEKSKQARFAHGGAIGLLLQHDVATGATMMLRTQLRHLWHPIPASWIHDGWITWMVAIHSTLLVVDRPLIGYRIHAQQQLGVGGTSRLKRLKQRRNVERQRYARVANQFEELLQYVRQLPMPEPILVEALSRKVALLRRRSVLPRTLFARVLYMGPDVAAYRKYARGWRSVFKDLFL